MSFQYQTELKTRFKVELKLGSFEMNETQTPLKQTKTRSK